MYLLVANFASKSVQQSVNLMNLTALALISYPNESSGNSKGRRLASKSESWPESLIRPRRVADFSIPSQMGFVSCFRVGFS